MHRSYVAHIPSLLQEAVVNARKDMELEVAKLKDDLERSEQRHKYTEDKYSVAVNELKQQCDALHMQLEDVRKEKFST